MSYKIKLDREGCIGCGACTQVAPDFWEMGEDNKTVLKGAEGNEKEIEEKDLETNKSAAEACPVNVIHIFKDDEKII